jgi:glucose/arabinose dehydrogenase
MKGYLMVTCHLPADGPMKTRSLVIIVVVVVAAIVIVALSATIPQLPGGSVERPDLPLSTIRLPAGFSIGFYAGNVPGARSLARGPDGMVFVGTREAGRVYALVDSNGDQHADRVVTLADTLFLPNGVAYRNGSLYVAEVSRVVRYDDIANRLDNPPAPVVVSDAFPGDVDHGWKFIAFGPDGKLYVPVGAPCNACVPPSSEYAAIHRMNADGSDLERYASGIRNTVGFDWDPLTGDLWFTDNGRDWLGENLPPDELNFAPESGLDFGFPYCYGENVPDPDLNAHGTCAGYIPAAEPLPAHVASLGMRFYTGTMFPEHYQNQIFIAEHGSWNRIIPTGYRVSLVRRENNTPVSYEIFAEGWLQNGVPWGRPVDVLVMPDGALLVSDDLAGAVYRISSTG